MKKFLVMCIIVTATLSYAETSKSKDVSIKSDTDKLSYSIGIEIGTSLRPLKDEMNMDFFTKGIIDGLNNNEPLLTQEEMVNVKKTIIEKMKNKQISNQKEHGDKNLKLGKEYMSKNKTKKNVTTTSSGLQYSVIRMGEGKKPKSTDRVKVHYQGTLIDGTEFDSSYKRGEPAVFPLNGVISGWTEGLQLMPVGSKFQFVIPPNLAYGERGTGGTIGPNATLIFDVELLEIVNQ